jgi:amino acid adenylation domain-containing protein
MIIPNHEAELASVPQGAASRGSCSGVLADVHHRASHVVQVYRHWAWTCPDRRAYLFLSEDGSRVEHSYAEIDARARAIAARLQSRGLAGERALLVFEPGLDYVSALLGCLYAGVVAVPAYPPEPMRLQRTFGRLQRIVDDCRARVMLTSSEMAGRIEGLLPQVPRLDNVLRIDEVEAGEAARWTLPALEPGTLALVQYTSGSTAMPKGVMISHGNLLANLKQIHLHVDHPDNVCVSWLPAYHDMGLISILALGFSCRPHVMMSPLSFFQKPVRWLQAISEFRGGVSPSPNFGYDLCVRKVDLAECAGIDLSSWTRAMNGAEPLRPDTIARFSEKFAGLGMRPQAFMPAYGMAEATLMIAGGEPLGGAPSESFDAAALREGRAEPAVADASSVRTLVCCGRPVPDQRLVIVDPETREPLPENRVGEIWLSGPNIGSGYWENAAETDRSFQARTSTGAGPFLRTGDMGFLRRGELFITGRRKELVIFCGRNHYPQDIERTVEQCHGELRPYGGAVFAIDDGHGERVVIVHEVARARRIDLAALLEAIRRRVGEEHQIPVDDVVLIRQGSLPKTSSGKTQRAACREQYLAGELNVVARWNAGATAGGEAAAEPTAARTPTEALLAGIWCEVLGLAEVGMHDDFFALGGNSLLATQLLSRITQAVPTAICFSDFFLRPTIEAVARVIDERAALPAAAGPHDVDRRPTPPPFWPGANEPHDRPEWQPLSFAQEGFWFLDRLTGGTAPLRVAVAMRLEGPLDRAAFERAWAALVRRHASMRTDFAERDGRPMQRSLRDAEPAAEFHDFSGLAPVARAAALCRFQDELSGRPLDPTRGPPCHVALVRLAAAEHVCLLVMHHILCDGWSLEVLRRDLAALYAAEVDGCPAHLPAPALEYADYAAWQQGPRAAEVLDSGLAYWKRRLAGCPTVLDLPGIRMTAGDPGSAGRIHARMVSAELLAGVRALALREKVTPFMVFLAAWGAVLARYTQTADLCIGTAAANRGTPGTEGLVGCFVNTVPLRCDLAGDPTFLELLGRARGQVAEDLSHAEVPLGKLVETLSPERRPGRLPLVQVMMLFQDAPASPCAGGPVRFGPLEADYRSMAPFDLTLVVEPRGAEWAASLVHDDARLDEGTVARMLDAYLAALESAVAEPHRRIGQLPIPALRERRRMLAEFNATDRRLPAAKSIHELFEARAAQHPERPAVEDGDGRLTYGELDARANKLARFLQGLGVGPDERVGLHLGRTVETVVAMLAVLKAGGAYVPLDPAYPARRLEFMAEDAALRVLLTDAAAGGEPPAVGCPVVDLGVACDAIAAHSSSRPACRAAASHLAYLIYTSGSTGTPKGVMIPRGAVVNFAVGMADLLDLAADDRFLGITTMSFDIAVLELLVPLTVGASVTIAGRDTSTDGVRLRAAIEHHGITLLQATPSSYRMLCMSGWRPGPGLRLVCGGEPLDSALAASLMSGGSTLWNVYGPTETTVWSTAWRVEAGGASVPIGRPIANTRAYVLDEAGAPVPIGAPGELCLGGLGVARGYWNQPELTAARFGADPFDARPGAMLYRTGDRVRWRGDGVLDFLGRLDGQVKIRGFRVELGEVEAALGGHESVAHAAVAARSDGGGAHYLAAYVVPAPGWDVRADELRAFLRARLPDCMIPTAFVPLESLPRTPAGKIDRRGLPEPQRGQLATTATFVAPRTDDEARIAALWADVLQVRQVGANDDFFELGGHSLLATQVCMRLRAEMGVEVPLRAIFERSTVAGLAALVGDSRGAAVAVSAPIRPVPRGCPLPLSFAQERLWLVQQMEPESPSYNMPVVMRLPGDVDVVALRASVNTIVARHEALRTSFPVADGRPVQVITPSLEIELPVIDASGAGTQEREDVVRLLAGEQARHVFDLAVAPLVRVCLVKLSPAEHVLLWTMHHIVADGWSMGILLDELTAVYEGLRRGQPVALPELPLQYADYAVWQREAWSNAALDGQLAHWKRALADLPELDLPTDRPRPDVQRFRGACETTRLPAELVRGLAALARDEGSTLFGTLLAGFQALLSRYTSQDDIAVGTGIANRNRAELEGLVGFFVNALVMRTSLEGDPTFRGLVRRVRQVCLDAYALQDVPFDRLVEALQPHRRSTSNPLCRVFMVLQNFPLPSDVAGLNLDAVLTGTGTAKFDLTLYLRETADGLVATIEYDTDLFDAATVGSMLEHFERLLAGAVATPDERISRLPLLGERQRLRILEDWNDTAAEFPRTTCITRLFEEQVRRTPHAPAVECGDEALTYAELNARANQLARHLRGLGVGCDVPVGLCTERSLEMVVGVLGILKAGGAYVPLDPDYPAERLAFMLADTRGPVLVSQERVAAGLPPHAGALVRLDTDWPQIGRLGRDDLSEAAGPADLAYLIYTSGSTGTPKGVGIEHRGWCNLAAAQRAIFGVTAGDRVLQFASLSFDASAWELTMALLSGATLCLAPAEELLPGSPLARFIGERGITVATLPPSALDAMQGIDGADLAGLRILVSAGEACPAETARRWAPGRRFINAYGPTEATVCATLAEWDGTGVGPAPIGRPIANTQVYVLDRTMQPVPPGVPGELWIGGDSLARGYWNRPDMTAAHFVTDSFSRRPSARLYRTGDLVRWRCDGTLAFLGRLDQQVKVRGCRIELGEIESVLRQHPEVRQAVVVARNDNRGGRRLVGYFVPRAADPGANAHAPPSGSEQVSQWRALYDETYSQAEAQLEGQAGGRADDPTFNTIGWKSSFTGEPLPADEMREWLDATVARITALRPERVLEIGCGSGMVLFRVAPNCREYWGTDFSPAALAYVERHMSRPGCSLPHVRLLHRPADDFEGFAPGSLDAVVLNSVVQYFPNVAYLLDVVRKAARAVRPGGFVFLGDVRNVALLEALHATVELHKAPAALSARQLLERVRDRMAQEEELLVAPELFAALPAVIPAIGRVETLLKRGRCRNELTMFRYEVILYVGPREPDDAIDWSDWPTEGIGREPLARMVREHAGRRWGVRHVPNARTADAVAVAASLNDDTLSGTVAELRRAAARGAQGVEPEDLWELAEQNDCRARIGWSQGGVAGCFDVVFAPASGPESDSRTRPACGETEGSGLPAAPAASWGAWANNPAGNNRRRRLGGELRDSLRTRLPDFMVPAALVPLESLPLSANGKVDTHALPAPDGSRPELTREYVAPRDDTERLLAGIWSEMLGIDRVGVHDGFFDLGGHSMLAVQLMAEIERHTGRRLPLASFFQEATVGHLAEALAAPEPVGGEPALVPLARTGRRRPFFCVHPAGGTVFCYRELAESLQGQRPFYGIQAAGVDGTRQPLDRAEDMAARYVAALRSLQPEGPYLLGGWSAGGILAFEMARQLSEQGQEVSLLALFDAGAAAPSHDAGQADFAMLLADLFPGRDLPPLATLQAMTAEEQLAVFADRAARAQIVAAGIQAHAARHVFEVFKANLRALRDYRPRPYAGQVTLFAAEHRDDATEMARDPLLGWGAWAQGGVEVHRFPCNHVEMVSAPHVQAIGAALRSCLERAGA